MTINTSHANITGGITNDILNILDITDSLYTNDTLDTIDRASLNDDCMTNSHDERQWDDNDDAMTETDSDITRGYRGYRGYNEWL